MSPSQTGVERYDAHAVPPNEGLCNFHEEGDSILGVIGHYTKLFRVARHAQQCIDLVAWVRCIEITARSKQLKKRTSLASGLKNLRAQ